MINNTIKRKLRIMDEIQDSIDDHIWKIFKRYIMLKKINFNSPYDWKIEGCNIYFHGSDGCMGCYDNMSLSIHTKFFIDPEVEFDILEKEIEKEESKKKSKKKQENKKQDLAQLKRLKEKYEA